MFNPRFSSRLMVALWLALSIGGFLPGMARAVTVIDSTQSGWSAKSGPVKSPPKNQLTQQLTKTNHHQGVQVLEGTQTVTKPHSLTVTQIANSATGKKKTVKAPLAFIAPPASPQVTKKHSEGMKAPEAQTLIPGNGSKEAIPEDFFTNLMDILDYSKTGTLIPAKSSALEARYKLNKQYGLPLPFENTDVNNGNAPVPLPHNSMVATAVGMVWPMQKGTVSSHYGMRWGRLHQGTDIAAPYGTPILAANNGMVSYAGWRGGYGKLIVLSHDGGFKTRYGHCSNILVREGQSVQKGDVIGLVGSTGHSTGPHLHYEIVTPGGGTKNPESISHTHH